MPKNYNSFWFLVAFLVWVIIAYYAISSKNFHNYTNPNIPPPDEYDMRGGGSWGK